MSVSGGTATISGGSISGGGNGLKVSGGAASLSGGSLSGIALSDISVSGVGTVTVSGCNLLLANSSLFGILQDGTALNMAAIAPPGQLILSSATTQINCPTNQTALATSAAVRSHMAVRISPGSTEFTRTPSAPYFFDSALAVATIAAFVAAYSAPA